jgi:Ca2+-binding EF-hand superfamily protein
MDSSGRKSMRSSVTSSQSAFEVVGTDASEGLSFNEFALLAQNRGKSAVDLRRLFQDYDVDGSGKIDRGEFVLFALLDALGRAHQRVLALFREADANHDRSIDPREFRSMMRSLNFSASEEDIKRVFCALDENGDGKVSLKELQTALRPETIARNRVRLRNRLVERSRDPNDVLQDVKALIQKAKTQTQPAAAEEAVPEACSPKESHPAARIDDARPTPLNSPPAREAPVPSRAAPNPALILPVSRACKALGLRQPTSWASAAAIDAAALALTAAWAVATLKLVRQALQRR